MDFGEKMNIVAIVIIGVIGAILGIIIKQYKPEYSVLISLLTGVMILGAVIAVLQPLLNTIKSLTDAVNLNDVYGKILLKALAVCYITQLAVDCCKDAGETAIASKLEMAGKVAILLIALPLFEQLVNIVTALIDI